MDVQLPAGVEDKRRNLTIRRDSADERWYWIGSGTLQRIDLSNYYARGTLMMTRWLILRSASLHPAYPLPAPGRGESG